jgi:hypothetical protein
MRVDWRIDMGDIGLNLTVDLRLNAACTVLCNGYIQCFFFEEMRWVHKNPEMEITKNENK